MNIEIKILREILVNSVNYERYYVYIIHEQDGFIPGMQGGFNI